MIHTPALLDVSLHKRSDEKNSHRNLSLHQGYRLYLAGNFRTDLCITHITCHNRYISFYFLITYGVCKKRKYCNRMSEKEKFSLFDEFSCFVCLRRQNERKKISVRLSVCLSGCMWNLCTFYVWNVGLVLKSKVKSWPWSWSWTEFRFLKKPCGATSNLVGIFSTLEIPSNEIPSNERSLIQARYRSLQRAADQPLFPHYYGIKRARIWNSS